MSIQRHGFMSLCGGMCVIRERADAMRDAYVQMFSVRLSFDESLCLARLSAVRCRSCRSLHAIAAMNVRRLTDGFNFPIGQTSVSLPA